MSEKLKVIHIRVPKTGSSSLNEMLKPTLKGYKKIISNKFHTYGGSRKHIPASIIKQELNEDVWNNFTKIAFIRHPLEQIHSMYYHFLKHEIESYPGLVDISKMSDINSFVPYVFARFPYMVDQQQSIFDTNKNLLVDHVGRFEKYQADAELILNSIGVRPSKIIHTNKNPRKPQGITLEQIKSFYNEESLNIIKSHMGFFSEYFGYQL